MSHVFARCCELLCLQAFVRAASEGAPEQQRLLIVNKAFANATVMLTDTRNAVVFTIDETTWDAPAMQSKLVPGEPLTLLPFATAVVVFE